jgi:CDP-diacylglycerol---glycerol-3-phosphate 3-phosphatidyltransferase
VVIQASWLGKLKTVLQVAAIICLIAVDPAPLGVNLLVYAAVAVTVISGVDYFFGFRRMLSERQRQTASPSDRSRNLAKPS